MGMSSIAAGSVGGPAGGCHARSASSRSATLASGELVTRRRTPRDQRHSSRAVLTSRDEALLRALNRFRVARTSDLRRLLFADRSAGRAAERLRQLFRGGYLQVRLGRLSDENMYSLGPAGKKWLESAGVDVGRLPSGSLAHHLAIVSAWTRLATCLQAHGPVRLKRFRPDWEIRQLQQGLTLPVVPDALVELEVSGRVLRIALEIDLATERHVALRKKFETYRHLRWRVREEWGWPDLRLVVLVWAGGSRREASMRRLLEQSGLSDAVIASEPAWPDVVGTLVAQPPLTSPVSSKRGNDVLTDEISGPSAQSAGEPSLKNVAGSVCP